MQSCMSGMQHLNSIERRVFAPTERVRSNLAAKWFPERSALTKGFS